MDKKKNKRRPGNKKKKTKIKTKQKCPAVFHEAKDRPTLDRLKHLS